MYLPNHFENADLPVVPGAILGNSHPFARREFDAEIARCPEGFYCTHMRALKRSDSFGIRTIGGSEAVGCLA